MIVLRRSVALAIGAALLLTAPALAAERKGTTAIDLGGKAVKSLRGQDVRIAAKRPARVTKGVLRLPVTKGLVSRSAYLSHGGRLVMRRTVGRHKRTISIRKLQARLGSTSRVVGSVGRKRFTIFRIRAPRKALSINASFGSASLRHGRVTLTRKAAAAIKRRLSLKRLPAGPFGAVTVDALVGARAPGPGGGTGGSGGGGGGGTPGGGGPPVSGPITDEPPALPRPAGAVDVTGATLTWHLRDSWIRYVSTEKPVMALDGAIAGAPIEGEDHPCPDVAASPGPLVYSYTMHVASGWHDSASGATALYSTGGARFAYPSHGIDLDVKGLEVELNGAASRVIARFEGRGATNPGNKRGVLLDLAPTPVAPASPTLIKATIPTGGSQSVFAGFYAPGEGFGCISVSYSVP